MMQRCDAFLGFSFHARIVGKLANKFPNDTRINFLFFKDFVTNLFYSSLTESRFYFRLSALINRGVLNSNTKRTCARGHVVQKAAG